MMCLTLKGGTVECAYCRVRRGHQTDHLITKNQSRRSIAAASARERPEFRVPCCSYCNQAKATRLLVPESREHLIPELQALTHGKYQVWLGDAESLRGKIQ